jgi:RHS repeat-associated protein
LERSDSVVGFCAAADVPFLHTDHLGSPVAATDGSGSSVGTAAYYPFGELRTGTGSFDTERGFTGQVHDAGTGLNFYNARYMDSALGRFISPDSIVPIPANPSNYNRFAYVTNNPLRYTDPTGFSCEGDSADDPLGCANGGGAIPIVRIASPALTQPAPVKPSPIGDPGDSAGGQDSGGLRVTPEPVPTPPYTPPPEPVVEQKQTRYQATVYNTLLYDGQRALATPSPFVMFDVVVLDDLNPLYWTLRAQGKSAITLFETVYVIGSKLKDVDLMYHEAVHVLDQRETGAALWMARYSLDVGFRRDAEEKAYAVQARVAEDRRDGRSTTRVVLKPR